MFMTYLNPVFHYGYKKFFTRCEQLGISGIIIPDMPYEEKGELDETGESWSGCDFNDRADFKTTNPDDCKKKQEDLFM